MTETGNVTTAADSLNNTQSKFITGSVPQSDILSQTMNSSRITRKLRKLKIKQEKKETEEQKAEKERQEKAEIEELCTENTQL